MEESHYYELQALMDQDNSDQISQETVLEEYLQPEPILECV